MIQLASDYLLFQLPSGESLPLSANKITVELVGNDGETLDSEYVGHATAAVFHHFKNDLGQINVTLGEFALALEKALRGFGLETYIPETAPAAPQFPEADLRLLVAEAGKTELLFFPRLRDELRSQIRQSPRMLRFRGLRGCVKQLIGVRRWNPRCGVLQDQIIEYLRRCLCAENNQAEYVLMVK